MYSEHLKLVTEVVYVEYTVLNKVTYVDSHI